MALTSEQVLGWSRVGVLLLGMGWAAWMDHKERRVSNDHWVVWVKPAIFLWCLELLARRQIGQFFLRPLRLLHTHPLRLLDDQR